MIEASNSTNWIDQFLRFLQHYYTPTLVHLGLLGNCLSMCVFFGTKLRYTSSSIYLGALAISDSGYLIVHFVSWLTIVKIELFNQPGYCQFFTFLGHIFPFLSVWLVVAFTVERYIAVKWPLRRRSLCTVARAKIVVIGLTALAIPLCSPVILFSKSNTNARNMTRCGLNKNWASWANAYNTSDTIITFVVPLTVIVIFNTLIARNIYKSNNIRRTMTIESTSSENQNNPRDRIPQTKVTKMLLIVSSAFFCFNMPFCVFRLIGFLYGRRLAWLSRAQILSYQIYATSFGINFVLYCVGGRNFRNAMIRIFIKHSDSRRSGTLLHMTNHGKQNFSESTHRYSSTKRPHFDDEQPKNAQETQMLSTTPDEKPPINE